MSEARTAALLRAVRDDTPRGWARASARITGNAACMDVAAWLAGQGG